MSEFWRAEIVESATTVPPWIRQGDISQFRAWSPGSGAGHSYADHDPAHVSQPGDVQARAFAEGFEEGRRAVEEIIADERASIARMLSSLEMLKPQPSQGLAMLLAETVERLVHQIMGEVSINRETLLARANHAAELISEEAGAMRLRLNPEDIEMLEGSDIALPIVADTHLERGTIMLESDEGWIEDSPDARLAKLRAALDTMGLAVREEQA